MMALKSRPKRACADPAVISSCGVACLPLWEQWKPCVETSNTTAPTLKRGGPELRAHRSGLNLAHHGRHKRVFPKKLFLAPTVDQVNASISLL